MWGSILMIIAQGLKWGASICEQRANPKAVAARVMKDETKKADDFNRDLKEENLEEVRKHLS